MLDPTKIYDALKATKGKDSKQQQLNLLTSMLRTLGRLFDRFRNSQIAAPLFRYRRTETNVLSKYDRMAGQYVKAYHQDMASDSLHVCMAHREYTLLPRREARALLTAYVSSIMRELGSEGGTILEAGAGELTKLMPIAKQAGFATNGISALDLSWSRLAVGRAFARAEGVELDLITAGSVLNLPFANNSFDFVLTSHCLEQIPDKKRTSISELARVANKWLVLLEPSYEFACSYQKQRMRNKDFIRGIHKTTAKLGLELVRHERMPHALHPYNVCGLYVIKPPAESRDIAHRIACPVCHGPLEQMEALLYCPDCATAYPVLDGIPCLNVSNGVPAAALPRLDQLSKTTN